MRSTFAEKKHRLLRGSWGYYARRVGRQVMLIALGLLALAALVRMLTALVEALTLMLLACIAAVLVVPPDWRRSWRSHWRTLRREAAAWLYTAARTVGSVPRPPQSPQEQGQEQGQAQEQK